jgi:predicted outer membrane repeat protein
MGRLTELLTALIAITASTTVFGDTVVPGGAVSGTWVAAGSPYLIQGDIIINNGSTLTIEPGVAVNFQGRYLFTVNGELQAVGTEVDSINFFAANTVTGWKGVTFFSTGFGRIEFATVQYARTDEWGLSAIYVGSMGYVDITHCTISNNNSFDGGGICLEPSFGANFTISHCDITHNEASHKGGGIYGGGVGTIEYCVISDNLCNGADVSGGGAYIYSPIDTVKFDHCTFSRNDGIIVDGLCVDSPNAAACKNCIFEGHSAIAIGVYSGTVGEEIVVTYTDFFNNGENALSAQSGFGNLAQENANGDSCDIYGNIFMDPLFCDAGNWDLQIAENSPCLGAGEGGTDIGALGIGCGPVNVHEQAQPQPIEYSLSQNYPNPFNPETVIEFNLDRRSEVVVSVYNLMGQRVADLADRVYPAGSHMITWDGTMSGGKRASAGVYFYRIETGEYTEAKKMLLLK